MTTTPKRIPKGTRVRWSTYPADPATPVHEGVVVAFVARWDVFPGRPAWDKNLGADLYLVDVDRTPTGQPRKTPKQMRPYASRLEAQNPDKVEG